jgi:hypothetical protein
VPPGVAVGLSFRGLGLDHLLEDHHKPDLSINILVGGGAMGVAIFLGSHYSQKNYNGK